MWILLAETDRAWRSVLADKLAADRGLVLAGEAADLSAAYHAAEHRPPRLALIGADLAVRPEFEVLVLLFRALAVKCLVLHQGPQGTRAVGPLAARLGVGLLDATLPAQDFCVALRQGYAGRAPGPAVRAASPCDGTFRPGHAILIGASTGGVEALRKVLSEFPADCPPTLIVQHTGEGFSASLARLLDSNVAPHVAEACDGETLVAGRVLIAPGSTRHMVLAGQREKVCRLVEGPPASGHRPSIDALFRSAVPAAASIKAALLTGMGRDGAEGLTRLRQAGCQTIGQDEATSVVYGMPKVAKEMGGVALQLSLGAIGPALIGQCRMAAA